MSKPHSLKPWIGACLLAAVLGTIAWFLLYQGPATQMARVATAAANALGMKPIVVHDNVIVLEPTEEIAELALASKSFKQTYHWKHKWMGSTKELEVEGIFTAKAGYVLDSPLQLMIPADASAITATLPDPEVLSLEQESIRIVDDENGFWNRLTNEDRETVFRELKKRAKTTARDSGLLEEADRALVNQLEGAIAPVNNQRTPIEVRRITPKG